MNTTQPDQEDQDVFHNVSRGLVGHYREIMVQYWQELINEIEQTNEQGSQFQDDFKSHSLPLARIKKVMKTDEDVRMISAEAPILFAKACEIFITELTMRAWCIAEENKRRTLQKQDVAQALQKSDMFDFLIDIVPRRMQ
ncbi:HDL194Wp [Eremothecium sinecaudum]|uniref:HDL194Wp n=1 Tax=Eremothecium sinecaudum TaxID=45286 RepID=A0A120K262_9SACH|nr:HDL194Wp [Eremothecium sinecaudum]AMD20550.1 HDL194Wp [Eremothecium sinecaudum]